MNSQEKTLENLIKEKNTIINEWFNEINNFEKDDDLIWSQKNKTFADKLYNILYLLQKNSNSNNIKLQYDLTNTVGKYINEKNRGKVLSIIKNLKSLEISMQENNNLDINDIDSYTNSIDNKILEIEKEELDGKPEEEQIILKEKWQKEDEEFKKIFNDNFYVINDDKITITKKEYDQLKHCQEDLYQMEEFISPSNDFSIKLKSGSVLPMTHPNYHTNRIDIEILDIEKYSIKIENKEYRINFDVLKKIKEFINKNIEVLIKYSLSQNKKFMLNNSLVGGGARTITIKYGKLIISIDGQVVGEIGEFCKNFMNEIKELIINANVIEVTNDNDTINLLVEKIKSLPNGTEFTISQLVDVDTDKVLSISIDTFKKLEEQGIKIKSKFDESTIMGLPQNTIYIKVSDDKVKSYMEMFINTPTPELSGEEKEFDKYCKLYEERFGKRPYIPEPSGTKEFAIECIKKCLTENKDILDDLYYPNFKKDMENGVLYSETRNDLNNDNFDDKITDERLKIIIEEVIGNNDGYLNTTIYDIVKKIIDLPYENVATIADLISYNPNQVFVEPITQGKIMNLVKETCKKLNIKLETNKDSFGGLAYYSQFKKINQLNLVDKATLNGDEKNV